MDVIQSLPLADIASSFLSEPATNASEKKQTTRAIAFVKMIDTSEKHT